MLTCSRQLCRDRLFSAPPPPCGCDGPHVCAPYDFHIETLTDKVVVSGGGAFRRSLGQEGRASELPDHLSRPQDVCSLQPRQGSPMAPATALDFSPPGLGEINVRGSVVPKPPGLRHLLEQRHSLRQYCQLAPNSGLPGRVGAMGKLRQGQPPPVLRLQTQPLHLSDGREFPYPPVHCTCSKLPHSESLWGYKVHSG